MQSCRQKGERPNRSERREVNNRKISCLERETKISFRGAFWNQVVSLDLSCQSQIVPLIVHVTDGNVFTLYLLGLVIAGIYPTLRRLQRMFLTHLIFTSSFQRHHFRNAQQCTTILRDVSCAAVKKNHANELCIKCAYPGAELERGTRQVLP